MGSDNSRGVFDNVRVQVLAPEITYESTEDFADGMADLFTAGTSGTWGVAGGRYTTTPSGTAASLVDLPVVDGLSTNALLELSAKVNTQGRAGFVFDRYALDDFKFVAIDAVTDQVIIGHYTKKSGWVNDAVASRTINAGTDYTLGISVKATTVSVTLNGQAVVGHAFNAVAVDGDFGLLAVSGQTSFDDVKIKTSDRAFAPSAGSNMLASESMLVSESGATLTQAELDSAVVTAMSEWTETLGDGDPRLAGFGSVHVTTADLGGDALGYTEGRSVWIDENAAGHGWSLHGGSMDLATVVAHELGHLLGFEHRDEGVMAPRLQAPVRLDTDVRHADAAPNHEDTYLGFDLNAGPGSGGAVHWQMESASDMTPFLPTRQVKHATNFVDYFVKYFKRPDGPAGFDSLGKALLGSKSGKGTGLRT
jgi:hypothetical protein